MIVKVMHPLAKKALHDLGTGVGFMFTCLEIHIPCVMLLTLLRFIICCIFSNFTKACVMSIGFTENAVSWCRWPSITWGSCNILIALVIIFWFSFETITLIGLVPLVTPFVFMWCWFDRCIVGVHNPSCWLVGIVWSALLADRLCFFLNIDEVGIKSDKPFNDYFLPLCFDFYFLFFPFYVSYEWNFSSISIRNELFSMSSPSKSK